MAAARAQNASSHAGGTAGIAYTGDEELGTAGVYSMREELERVTALEREGRF